MQKDSVINKLGTTVDSLGKNVRELAETKRKKGRSDSKQDKKYIQLEHTIVLEKELKDNKIIT